MYSVKEKRSLARHAHDWNFMTSTIADYVISLCHILKQLGGLPLDGLPITETRSIHITMKVKSGIKGLNVNQFLEPDVFLPAVEVCLLLLRKRMVCSLEVQSV